VYILQEVVGQALKKPLEEDELYDLWWYLSETDAGKLKRDEEFWQVKRYADFTGITKSRVRSLFHEGKLPGIRIDGYGILIHSPSALAYLKHKQSTDELWCKKPKATKTPKRQGNTKTPASCKTT